MSVFKATLGALNFSYADAAGLLDSKVTTITDIARGKMRVPPGMLASLSALFERVESAADEIIAYQAELGMETLTVLVATIPLPHRALREAAAARALLVIGPELLSIVDEPRQREPAA